MARTLKSERAARAKQVELAYRRRMLDALGLICEMNAALPLAQRVADAARATGLPEEEIRIAWLRL